MFSIVISITLTFNLIVKIPDKIVYEKKGYNMYDE